MLCFFEPLLLEDRLLSAVLTEEITDTAFAFVVATPAVDAPTGSQSDSVMFTTCDLDGLFLSLGPNDSRWRTHVLLVTDAELAVVVETPAE